MNLAQMTSDASGLTGTTSLGSGNWIRLNGSLNLVNIDSITFRTAGRAGIAELRQDAVDGPLVGSFTIPGTGGTTTYASHTVSLTPPAGLHDLFLVFRQAPGGPGNNFFNLNWVEFGGAGVGT